MIFSIPGHIDKIIKGEKTQTRRAKDRYKPFRLYAIQPGRGKKAIPDGKIRVICCIEEVRDIPWQYPIKPNNAMAEGGYTPEHFEALYEQKYHGWHVRYAYEFEFVRNAKNM